MTYLVITSLFFDPYKLDLLITGCPTLKVL
jgi:hypothetical protein